MAKALLRIALSLCLGIAAAQAQTAKQAPAWSELTLAQQHILAPLEAEWDTFDPPRKRKWLGIARRYPKMKREEQERLQRRMREWVSLTPAQRQAARDKYREFEQLPPQERQAVKKKWDEYKEARAAEESRKAAEDAQKAADPAGEKPGEASASTPVESAAAPEGAPSEASGTQQ